MLTLLLALAPSPQVPADWIDPLLEGARALERGELEAGREALERVQGLLPGHGASAYLLACATARAGELDAALAWLERAAEARPLDGAQLAWDPWLDALRGEPRFDALVAAARVVELPPREPAHELLWSEVEAFSATAAGDLALARPGARLLDATSGELIGGLLGPGERALDALLDPRGRWVAVAGERPRADSALTEPFLRVHDAASGDLVRELGDPGRRVDLAVSADGGFLLARGDWRTRLFETDGWTELEPAPPPCDSARLSPDGSRLALVSRSVVARREGRSGISIWDVRGRRLVAEHHDQADGSPRMGFDEAGARLFVVDRTSRATRVFDARTGALERELRSVEPPLSAHFLNGAGKLAVVELEGTPALARGAAELVLYDLATGAREPLLELPERAARLHDSTPEALLFGGWMGGPLALVDPGARRVVWTRALGERRDVEDARLVAGGSEVLCARGGCLERLDGATGELLARVGGAPLDTTLALACSSATAWLGCADGSLRELDLASGRIRRTLALSDGSIEAIDLDADDTLLAALDELGALHVVDLVRGELLATHAGALVEPRRWVRPEVDLAPRGRRALLSRPGERVVLLDLETGRVLAAIEPGRSRALQARWSPDGRAFVTAHEEPGLVRVRSGEDGASTGPELQLDGSLNVAVFEPSGERLWIMTTSSHVAVFDLASGELVRRLDHQDLDTLDTVKLVSVEFSPDGALAATASSNFGVVACWEVATGERRWGYTYNSGSPAWLSARFDPTGERVFVCGQGLWSPRVVDARSGETRLDLAYRGIGWIGPVPGGERVLARGARGVEVLDARGRVLWSRVELERGGSLLRAASGYVDGARGALETGHLLLAERSLPLDALASTLLDPAKLRAAAAGVALAAVELPEVPALEWREPPPRVVELGDEDERVEQALVARCSAGLVGFEQVEDGERRFLPGAELADGARVLQLDLSRQPAGHERTYRWRAIAADGTASRALRLRVTAR